MTIRRGHDWGDAGALAADAPVFATDFEASCALQASLDSGGGLPAEIGLVGGDLHRTLGAPVHEERDLRSGRAMRLPVDVGIVRMDSGEDVVMLAHLVAMSAGRGRIFNGKTLVVMNGAFVGSLNLGPRAHPNDGRLDVTIGTLPRADRRQARTRALTGSHLPHPALAEQRIAAATFDLGPDGLVVQVDGRHVGRARRLEVECRPDALVVVV